MNRAKISLTKLIEIANAFCNQHPRLYKRGRPPVYEESLVLSLWVFKQHHHLSWRKLESLARQILPNVPDYSTLYYRVRTLPLERWEEFNAWLAQQVLTGDSSEIPGEN
ncbi:MAG: hypothetical protein RMK30_08945 [Anaerolineae bacterium]|nr:hypothetical protein [Anaerolineae bacterium]MDW8102989.1 hypothetical protein [Anaerolineae bacterium]